MTQIVRIWAAVMPITLMAACASSGASGAAARPDPTVRAGGSTRFEVRLKTDETVIVDTVSAPPSRAFAGLAAIYRVLGIPVSRSESARGTVSAMMFKAPRRIEDQPLSRFLDCGRGITADDNADSYQVTMSVETRVTATASDPSRAVVQTTVSATAVPVASSGNAVQCSSRSRLESRIAELVRARLAAAGG